MLDYTNLFSPNDYKKIGKIICKYFKSNMSSLEFKLKQIDETRNHLSGKKHNDLMSEKYKKTCKYLNCVKTCLLRQLLVVLQFLN